MFQIPAAVMRSMKMAGTASLTAALPGQRKSPPSPVYESWNSSIPST
jgi:hypothetical protein